MSDVFCVCFCVDWTELSYCAVEKKCHYILRAQASEGGGAFTCPGPGGPWFYSPPMCVCVCVWCVCAPVCMKAISLPERVCLCFCCKKSRVEVTNRLCVSVWVGVCVCVWGCVC